MRPLLLAFKRLPGAGSDLPLPSYASEHASGMDVRAAVDLTVQPGSVVLVATGFSMEIPPGYEVQVRPRSGLAVKHGIGVLNSPGTIDADYRGEVKVVLFNFSDRPFEISRGDRIAQLVLAAVCRADIAEADELSDTARGAGGFGSSGVQ